MKQRIRFTKQTLTALPAPVKQSAKLGGTYILYHDAELRGLSLMVTAEGSKTFYLYQKVDGRPFRKKLGGFPDLSVENARNLALQLKGKLATGWRPETEKKPLTVEQLFQQYLERHAKANKRTWQRDEDDFRKYLKPLHKRVATTVTKSDVALLLDQLRTQSGKAQANLCVALLRSMYNRGMEWGLLETNPAIGVKLYKLQSRDRFLQPEEMTRFYAAIQQIQSLKSRSYFDLLLLTGARKTNLLQMRKQDVDLTNSLWRIPLTKNGQSQMVPLVPRAVEILKQLFAHYPHTDWVFATDDTASGHMENITKTWTKVRRLAGLENFRLHDLRRTFATYQVMQGASPFVIGHSLGHKSLASTAIYARSPLVAIRDSVHKATDLMEQHRMQAQKPSIAG